MHRTLLLVALFSATPLASLTAQDVPIPIGDQIRLSVTAAHGSRVVGRFGGLSGADSVCVSDATIGRGGWVLSGGERRWQEPRDVERACVPRNALTAVYVRVTDASAGFRTFGVGTLAGVVLGGGLSAFMHFVAPEDDSNFLGIVGTPMPNTLLQDARNGAIFGLFVGGFAGAMVALKGKQSRWKRLSVDAAFARIEVGRRGGSWGVGLALPVSFSGKW